MLDYKAVAIEFREKAAETEATCDYADSSDFHGAGAITLYRNVDDKENDIVRISTNGRFQEIEEIAYKMCKRHEGLQYKTWFN